MAMTANLWSINALATELGMDRRTLAKKLSGIEPDGELRGNPAWKLRTVIDAIDGRGEASQPDEMEVERLAIMRAKRRALELDNEFRSATDADLQFQETMVGALSCWWHLWLRPVSTWLFEELRRRGVPEDKVIAGMLHQWMIDLRAEGERKMMAAAATARRQGIVIATYDDLARLIPGGFSEADDSAR